MKKRFLYYLVLIFTVITINFVLPRALPGNPINDLGGEEISFLSKEEKQSILSQYNLDKPLTEQYTIYLKDLFTFNWGISYSKKQPIVKILGAAMPWTLLLCSLNLIISSILGCLLGARSVFKRKQGKDKGHILFISIVSSIPTFWIGMIFIALFSVKLKLFPIYGAYSLMEDYKGIYKFLDVLKHLVLPLATLVLSSITTFFLTMRYGMLSILGEDFIFMAKAKGLPDSVIKKTYIIRNSILPTFTVFMMDLGYIVSGSIVVENLFSYPGVGRIMFEAVTSRDYPLIQYSFLIISIMVILSNYLADILYKFVDPRVGEVK